MVREIRLSEPDPIALMHVVRVVARDARVTGWRALPGGVAHAMHRIDLRLPSGQQTAFVLRRGIPENGFDTDLQRQAATLEALQSTPVPAPELLWLDADGGVFGRPAMAMTLLPGQPRSADASTDPSVVRALAEALVDLSSVDDLTAFRHLDVDADPASLLTTLGDRGLPATPFADTRLVHDTLETTVRDLGPTTVGLCHGDLHVGNILFGAERVTGIVDWDSARMSDPRTDLAYASMDLALIGGLAVGDSLIREYEALKGPVGDLDWWCLRASTTTWGDLAAWLPGWHELGIDIDLPTVHARLRAWTDRHLAGLNGLGRP